MTYFLKYLLGYHTWWLTALFKGGGVFICVSMCMHTACACLHECVSVCCLSVCVRVQDITVLSLMYMWLYSLHAVHVYAIYACGNG